MKSSRAFLSIVLVELPLLLGAARGQEGSPPTADSILRGWESDEWEERERASQVAVDSWVAWTEEDLAVLSELARTRGGAEVGIRAEAAIRAIQIRRRLGPELVARGAVEVVESGSHEAFVELLVESVGA